MCFGVHARGHCVVVWERDAGEAGHHVLWRDAFLDELVQRGCQVSEQKVGAEAVEGNENRGRGEERGAV